MDIAAISLIGILIGVALLIILSYKGIPPIFSAPICAIVVLAFSWQNLLSGMITTYMGGFGTFATKYFLTFLTGSIFGSVMGDSGAAKSLAVKFARLAKRSKKNAKLFTVLSIVAVATILAYGGISSFVAMFTIIAVAKELFREMDVPWRIYGAQILGSGCLAMTILPGSPSIPNVISAQTFGTTAMAAPVLSLCAAVFALCLGIIYISWEIRHAEKIGEGFEPTGAEIAKTISPDANFHELSLIKCITPSLVLVVLYNLCSRMAEFQAVSTSAVVTATLVAIFVAYGLYWNRLHEKMNTAKAGMSLAINSICVVSMVVAFGTVVQAAPGFETIVALMEKLPGPPIVQLIVAVNVTAGITGSASGGLGIALNSFADRFINLGIDPQILHRIATMSSAGLGTLPHNSSVINELNVAKLTHKTGYRPIGVCAVVIPILTVIFAAILSQLGVV